jgi:translation initiation factor IF-1
MPIEITNEEIEQGSLSIKNEKTIDMNLLMSGLKISEGDLVVVDQTILYCNNKCDLVSYPSLKYSSSVPNLILGMISGKYKYKVIKISEIKEYN